MYPQGPPPPGYPPQPPAMLYAMPGAPMFMPPDYGQAQLALQEQLQQQARLRQLQQRAAALQQSHEEQRRRAAEALQQEQKARLHADLHRKLASAGLVPVEEPAQPSEPPPPPDSAPP
eukprot:EG_transcript_56092